MVRVKTRAGAEWVRSMVEGVTPLAAGAKRRVGLIAETYEQAREIMVFGESGLLAVCPSDRRPKWISGRRMLVWPNGANGAGVFCAMIQIRCAVRSFDAVWVDEFAKWRKAEEAWDMVQFCLRLGDRPQACVTTTPRNNPALRALLARSTTVKNPCPYAGEPLPTLRMSLCKRSRRAMREHGWVAKRWTARC